MAYRASNAAYAYDMYDMQPQSYSEQAQPVVQAPVARPSLHVVTGEGLEADQAVSPVFMHVVKLFCVLVALVFAVGLARIAMAGVTTSLLNDNAQISSSLETAQKNSSDLQVMRSVYGSKTRIRELATGALGMVEAEDGTTIDLSGASSTDAQ